MTTTPGEAAEETRGTGGRAGGVLSGLPRGLPLRQVGLIVALAAALALVAGIFFWAQQPVYRTVYSSVPEEERARIVEALQAADREFRVDRSTGAIQVPATAVHETRLFLAGEGLPRGQGFGYEMLREDQRFGTSQFMETARFQRAMETELSRSISSLGAVQSARVHLAMPRESVFIRENAQPSASVVVALASGRRLSDGQVAAIVHLVASSVPSMTEEKVTVVDQRGNLLTREEDAGSLGMSTRQFEYQQLVERTYARRIEELLTPMVGAGRVKAQVSAQIDFSQRESTEEVFDPDGSVIRSEQLLNERQERNPLAGGVPGALANQPPGGGEIAEDGEGGEGGQEAPPISLTDSATRNYEIGKTIRHVRQPQGAINRLTVAVLVDERTVAGEDGEPVREPLPEQEINRLTGLVQDAVGFNAGRGDSINIISAAFREVGDGEMELPSEPLWEQPWVLDLGRWVLAALMLLAMILLVFRPLINGLLRSAREDREAATETLRLTGADGQAAQPQLAGGEAATAGRLGFTPPPDRSQDHQARLDAAREMIQQDPALAANMVKNWLSDDGGR